MRGGQAVVSIILVLGVALTVGLAIVARSVTEINVATVQDESARALSAAVAGIEQSLGGVITGPSGTGSVGSAGDVFTVQKSFAGAASIYVVPEELVGGEAATVVVNSDMNSGVADFKKLRVCWGDPAGISDGLEPAVEIKAYFRELGRVQVNTKAYDAIPRGNGFEGGTTVCPSDSSYAYTATGLVDTQGLVPAAATPLFLRVRLVYNGATPHPVKLEAVNWDFPAQGEDITAVGQAGGVTQKVSVFKGTADWLPMWDDAVFSGTSLIQ